MAKDKEVAEAGKDLSTELLSRAMGGEAKIKLGGGVVGRIAYIVMSGMGTFAAVAGASAGGANPWVCGGILICASFGLYKGVSWILEYAHKNPLTATMEGAELLVHQRMKQLTQRSKSTKRISASKELISDPEQPAPLLLEVPGAEEPDEAAADPVTRKSDKSGEEKR